ncbi:hypothetical protein KTC96_00445 [Clostridium estertheticum]|uniref:hypothetical protein n=1 Tax=Clostridium estertheticum TaxID=238834 RepID=UPI00271519A4|nr:hypothetical protein [Clostridium estertheticum]WLC70550.1 hypothetical protein KTC96_00445 [Clostridium estertheticum]
MKTVTLQVRFCSSVVTTLIIAFPALTAKGSKVLFRPNTGVLPAGAVTITVHASILLPSPITDIICYRIVK